MWGFLAELVLDPSGVVDDVRDWRRERHTRKLARTAKISCAVRIVDGRNPGLSRRWIRGAARVPRGTLVLEPDAWWRAARITVRVRSAALLPAVDVPRRRRRGLGPNPRLIVLETAEATVEWLVPEDQVQRSMRVAP